MLKALGMTPESILKQFYEFDHYKLTQDGATLEIIPSRLRGEIAAFDIKDPEGKVIVAKDKRINAGHVREIENSASQNFPFRSTISLEKSLPQIFMTKIPVKSLPMLTMKSLRNCLRRFASTGLILSIRCTSTNSTAAPTFPTH